MRKLTKIKGNRTNFNFTNHMRIKNHLHYKDLWWQSQNHLQKQLKRYSSCAKFTAFAAAMTSTSTTEWGRGIYLDIDAKTIPCESCTTTPTLVVSRSLNTTPSKLILNKGGIGLDHLTRHLWTLGVGTEVIGFAFKKSAMSCLTIRITSPIGKGLSSVQSLLRDETIIPRWS